MFEIDAYPPPPENRGLFAHPHLQKVCTQAGVEIGDRLSRGSAKRKWLVSCLDESKALPPFEGSYSGWDFVSETSRQGV